jgi:lipoprotein NlpD
LSAHDQDEVRGAAEDTAQDHAHRDDQAPELETTKPRRSDKADPHFEHYARMRTQGAASTQPTAASTKRGDETPAVVPDARRALRGAATDAEKALAGERVFRNLLWPVKGGAVVRPSGAKQPGLLIEAPQGTGVRAAADGVVVHAGKGLADYGDVVALLHGNGWVTLYDGAAEIAVKPGERVLRGQWIARVPSSVNKQAHTTAHVRFEWRDAGVRKDPMPVLVGVPQER